MRNTRASDCVLDNLVLECIHVNNNSPFIVPAIRFNYARLSTIYFWTLTLEYINGCNYHICTHSTVCCNKYMSTLILVTVQVMVPITSRLQVIQGYGDM